MKLHGSQPDCSVRHTSQTYRADISAAVESDPLAGNIPPDHDVSRLGSAQPDILVKGLLIDLFV